MFNLLYKELRLAAHPNLFIFMSLGALVLVPAYPYGMIFMFGCLGPYISFLYSRETNDIYYTALLPVKKSDVVKSKCALMAFSQLVQLLISLPFAFLRTSFLPEGNIVGIEANAAFYGFGLMIYSIFNLIFLPIFFKTAQKVGKAFLLAGIPTLLAIIMMESIVHFPNLEWLDSVAKTDIIKQLPILIIGAAAYALVMMFAYKKSASNFEKVDL